MVFQHANLGNPDLTFWRSNRSQFYGKPGLFLNFLSFETAAVFKSLRSRANVGKSLFYDRENIRDSRTVYRDFLHTYNLF